jgi:eukaryotic-like serine/threonine-protein kinase
MTLDRPAPTLSRLGTYELLRPLAQGGMADIYLARRVGPGLFERHVAIKVLNQNRATDAEACTMFLDEARLLAMLNHQNIAAVFEVDVVDGKHYLAMEYVHGADLRDVLTAAQRSGRGLPFDVAVAIVCAAAAGLDHAHRRCGPDGKPLRLVHRDVSLSNIMVGHDGSVKVVDFGIASTTIASVQTLPGVVRGKASYMSPEQCLGDPVDHRADIFALGVVLYELTTGARCFHGKSDFDRMLAVVRTDYIAPSALVASYPPELEQVIRTALAADPARRFASAAAMIDALEQVAVAQGWASGPGSIQRMMRDQFGAVAEPWTSYADDAPATEPHALVLAALAEPTRVERRSREALDDRREREALDRRLARGTHGDAEDDPDEPTRGRARMRRSSRSLAA